MTEPSIKLQTEPPSQTFESFFDREYVGVVRLATALTGDRDLAEDLAQDGFLAAREDWDRVRQLDWPAGWVRRVVTNRAVSRRRRLASEARALSRLSHARPVELPASYGAVWEAVRKLPARQAQVIALVFIEDLSVAQVAEVLSCGPETVRTHLRRARARLAAILEEDDR